MRPLRPVSFNGSTGGNSTLKTCAEGSGVVAADVTSLGVLLRYIWGFI
jgi:hypothetical protein